MKNTFGNSISVTIFGESHGEAIGVVLDGMPSGVRIDREYIEKKLAQRRPQGKISTSRHEQDSFRIISGEFNGITTGTPLCLLIENKDTKSSDYDKQKYLLRPSHADYTAYFRYGGFQDYRGGGHFSGRITAPLTAAGAIFMSMLERKGIKIGTHIKSLHHINDRAFENTDEDIAHLSNLSFPVLDENKRNEMLRFVEETAKKGDSVGGVLETVITGFPKGVGEPWFDTIEGELSHILFSVPGVKGVLFGIGNEFATHFGSEINDEYCIKQDNIRTRTNNNGGINGGISNGEDILFQCIVKPTPSIYLPQKTVNTKTKTEETLVIEGRHDSAIIHRARAVVDSVTAIALADLICQRYSQEFFTGE